MKVSSLKTPRLLQILHFSTYLLYGLSGRYQKASWKFVALEDAEKKLSIVE